MGSLRRASSVVVVALAAAASDGAAEGAPDGGETVRTRVRQLVEMMATGDADSQAAAVDEMAKLGRPAVAEIGRCAHLAEDVGARDALVASLARIGVDDSIALLLAHPSYWPTGREADVRALVAALRARRDAKLAVHVDLRPADGTDAARVPPDAAFEIGDALPGALAWGEFKVRRTKTALQVDVDESGARVESLESDRPRCVRVGPRKRPLLVHRRLDKWFAASGALLCGEVKGEPVELWDADLDGSFAGPRDFVRLGDGAFQRIPDDGLVLGPQGLARMTVRTTDDGARLTLVPEPTPPDVGAWTLDALATINAWRRSVALPPVLLDLPRSAACEKHVAYWKLNGFTGHDEAPDRAGYTADGAKAGRSSSVWDTMAPERLARVITATVLHRSSALGAACEGLGVAYGPGACIWGGEVSAADRGFPVLVPGPGQVEVQTACEAERPAPDRDGAFYKTPRGYPVAVVWRRAWSDATNARLELFTAGSTEPVPGDLFAPETPYADGAGRGIVTGAATFVAAQPLARGRSHVARFRCDRASGPVEFTWTFTTAPK
jgi:hypothetical protein